VAGSSAFNGHDRATFNGHDRATFNGHDRATDGLEATRSFAAVVETGPIFVDISGRRGRRITWVTAAFAVVGLLFVGGLWFSQVGPAVKPEYVVPCQRVPATSDAPASPVFPARSAARSPRASEAATPSPTSSAPADACSIPTPLPLPLLGWSALAWSASGEPRFGGGS
jgi:hypothetical protein